MPPKRLLRIAVLSTADWNAEVWTNKQYLAHYMVQLGHEVTYIESLGLRRPALTGTDMRRIGSRLRRPNLSHAKNEEPREEPAQAGLAPHVVSPRVIPFHGTRYLDALNGRLLKGSLSKVQRPDILWTFSPVVLGLDTWANHVVYHAVDLLHQFPGINSRHTLAHEQRLVATAQHCIASSVPVQRHLLNQGAHDVCLWENVANVEVFSRVDGKHSPRVLFGGTLTTAKVDISLLKAIAAVSPLELAGPIAIDGTPEQDWKSLFEMPSVTYHGNLSPSKLAELAADCRVGIIPYNVNHYTEGVFPLKVYEYLAAGLAVVSTPLPAIQHLNSPHISIQDKDRFVATVSHQLQACSEPDVEIRRNLARAHSWERRIEQAENLLEALA